MVRFTWGLRQMKRSAYLQQVFTSIQLINNFYYYLNENLYF